jgi:hypothetical protein
VPDPCAATSPVTVSLGSLVPATPGAITASSTITASVQVVTYQLVGISVAATSPVTASVMQRAFAVDAASATSTVTANLGLAGVTFATEPFDQRGNLTMLFDGPASTNTGFDAGKDGAAVYDVGVGASVFDQTGLASNAYDTKAG